MEKRNKHEKKGRYSQSDFTEESLPGNRFEVFLDVLKTHWRTFLWIGLILFLFALPLILLETGQLLTLSSLRASFASGSLKEEEFASSYQAFSLMFAFSRFPCLLLLSLPLAGFCRVYRILVYYEMLSFKHDFLRGIKENGKNVFLLASIASLLYCFAAYFLANPMGEGFVASLLSYAPMFLYALFLLPPCVLCYCSFPFYVNSFPKAFSNSFPIYFSKAFHALGFLLLLFAPLFALPFCPFIPFLIILCLYFLLYLPLALLAFFLFSVYCFDRSINATSYPQIVDKGIHRKGRKPKDGLD